MTSVSPQNRKALTALTLAYKDKLAEFISKDELFAQVLAELTLAYVDHEIGMTDEEATHELAMMLFDSLTLTAQ